VFRPLAGLTAALGALGVAAAVQAQESPTPDLPVRYSHPVVCPACEAPLTVTIRQGADGRSVAAIHETAAPAPDGGRYVAGPRTSGRLGVVQDLGMDLIEVRDPATLEPGRRYAADGAPWTEAEYGGEASWSVVDLAIALDRGDDDRTVAGLDAAHHVLTVGYTFRSHDAQGDVTETRTVDHRRDLWFAEDLAFSPVQMLHGGFRDVAATPSFRPRIDQHVLAQVTDRFRALGALVRVETTLEGAPVAVAVDGFEPAAADAFATLETAPVVSEAQFAAVAGPFFIGRMISADGALVAPGPAELTLGDTTIAGEASWMTTDAGDLAVVIDDPASETMLFLVRPVNGVPAPGAYGVTASKNRAVLQAMTEAEMADHTAAFQVYGLVAGAGLPAAVTGFVDGTVTIDAVEDDRLVGSVEGTVTVLPTEEIGPAQDRSLGLRFEAGRGLEGVRFASPASRVR
jgi:hypothetical protein